MSGELERRWDGAVETAWREFRRRLADRLAGLVEDEETFVMVTGVEPQDAAPYCHVVLRGGLLEVDAVDGQGRTDSFTEVPLREADRAAVLVVGALREIYGVVHPVWLDAGGLEPPRVGFKPTPRRRIPPKPRPEQSSADEVMSPSSPEEVRAAVDLAVADLYEEAPEWDDDGDLPLPSERHVVWVTVSQTAPRVLLHCVLLHDVADERAARVEVNLLNRKEFGLAFTLRERDIVVMREIGLDVVLPSALVPEIQRLVGGVDDWARDLAERVRTGEPGEAGEPAPGRYATAYAVMVELEREERGSVGPATMARIFDQDTGLLLRALRATEHKRRELRRKEREAREIGKPKVARVHGARQDYLRDLATRIRAALRLIVEAPVRKVQLDQLALFGEDECGTSRSLEA